MFVTLIRTVILYIFAIVSIRIMGKRQIGELQPSDLVVTLLISQIISIPIQDTDIPLVNTIIPILLLVGFEILTSVFNMKSIKFRSFMQGNPVVIINDGVLNQKLLKELRFTIDDLLESLRQKDVFDISQVQYAIVETNGQLSVLLKPEHDTVTRDDLNLQPEPQGYKCPVIIDGKIVTQDFCICNTNKKKIEKITKKEKLETKEILLLTVDAAGNHTIIRKDNQ
ncbi:MAG: DUF421 domain-containing protein [Clostridia bacterium]|nr:DUF421 domain-containing protein [Clostridia bacterium]